jgi:glycosyltransferase involved in cell wall biosynthesis
MLLLDLENCTAGYSPTEWQRSRLPAPYQPKICTIFDGIDTTLWRRDEQVSRTILHRQVPLDTKIVTYVSPGFEMMRGLDIFMRLAKRIYQLFPNVLFVVAGTDRISYGGDNRFRRKVVP